MACRKPEVISYVEGIPVKIGEPFRPPKPVLLPLDFDLWCIPSGLLDEEYDFTLEKQVLAHAEAQERAKRAAEEACEQEKEEKEPSEESSHAAKDGDHSNNQVLLSIQPGIILQPQPMCSDPQELPENPQEKQKSFNPADFENDIASPFDYVELQTLNVLDELSTVFQGWKEPESAPDTSSKEQEHSSSICDDDSQNPGQQTAYNGDFQKNILLFDKSLNSEGGVTDALNQPVSDIVANPKPASESSASLKCVNSCGGILGSNGISLSTGSHNFFPTVSKQSSGLQGFSRLRSAKSASDISRMASSKDLESPSWRPSTPPPAISLEFQESADIQSVERKSSESPSVTSLLPQSVSPLEDATLSRPNTWVKTVVPSLPDPYHDLGEEEQKLVMSLTDMGFPRSRVARAVKYSGPDEKKVVDYLCQVQSLEESGYDSSEAETALVLNDYRIDEARTFLNMMNQFSDLGFEREAVKRALVKHKNDRDKALDVLLSLSS